MNVSLLIKPVSGACNLQCEYCFYRDVLSKKRLHIENTMSAELLERLIEQAVCNTDDCVQLAFQGGEPMLAGLDFYKNAVDIIDRYSRPGIRIEKSIQTNGTLITQEWARFFSNNNFLVGVSIDGIERIHDEFRAKYSTAGNFHQVVLGIKILQENNVPFNTLSVVTAQMSRNAHSVYETLKSIGVKYMQFIPCIEPFDSNEPHRFSLSSDGYATFLLELFDCWYSDYMNGQYISIRTFDDFVHLLSGKCPGACASSGKCGQYMVIEADGSAYPCDFFATDEYCIGRFGEQTLAELCENLLNSNFIKCPVTDPECYKCLFHSACRGGCRRDYTLVGGHLKNRYCDAYKKFFMHSYPRLLQIAAYEHNYQKNYGKEE